MNYFLVILVYLFITKELLIFVCQIQKSKAKSKKKKGKRKRETRTGRKSREKSDGIGKRIVDGGGRWK